MINQPEELKTLEQQIVDARNTLSSIEQDQIRFNKLLASDRYSLEQVANQKAELDSFIETLSKKVIEGKKSLQTVEDTITDKEVYKSELLSSIIELENKKTELEQSIVIETESVKSKTKELQELEKSLSKREDSLVKKEALLAEKLELIKQFKSSI